MKRIFSLLLLFIFLSPSFSVEIYKSTGYGYIVALDSNKVQLYDYTSVSLLKSNSGIIEDSLITLYEGFGISTHTVVKHTEDSLIVQSYGKNTYYSRISELPPHQYSDSSKDAVSCFEIFWHTFNENCLIFDVAGVDWDKTYEQYRPKVDSTTTDSALYSIFKEMLQPLKDAHTNIGSLSLEQIDNFGPEDRGQIWANNADSAQKIINHYFKENTIYKSKSKYIVASHISDEIGYLGVHSFGGYSEFYEGLSEIESFKVELDSAIDLIGDVEKIIVDLRFNGGGLDQLSFELVSRFVTKEQIGYYRQVKLNSKNEFSAKETFLLSPNAPSLSEKKTIVLVSEGTISAADVCAMLFKNSDEATLIGETTFGIFSDMLVKFVPNGFLFSLSNEKYTDRNNIYYEQKGIDPNIKVAMKWEQLSLMKDNILDSALFMLSPPNAVGNADIASNNIKIYKSGNSVMLKIESAQKDNFELIIYDTFGRLVLKKNVFMGESENTVKLDGYFEKNKVYIGNINNQKTSMSFKFIH